MKMYSSVVVVVAAAAATIVIDMCDVSYSALDTSSWVSSCDSR